MKVLVVTPTTGSKFLASAIDSVKSQLFDGEIDHLLIVDGKEYLDSVNAIAPELEKIVLPKNVGASGYYGHRAYAAMSHVISDSYTYVFFLDEDNWYLPNHVQTCVNTAESNNYEFSYSLRSFYTVDGEYFDDDNCGSLGKWKLWDHGGHHLVDTSAYCFRRQFIEKNGYRWHNGYAADRIFYESVMNGTAHGCTGKRTLAYRLGSPESSKYEEELKFIADNNKLAKEKYPDGYPWEF